MGGMERPDEASCWCSARSLIPDRRMSAMRAETSARRGDFRKASAEMNVAARKPAESSRSFVVSRIDSSSSTTATRNFCVRFDIAMAGAWAHRWREAIGPAARGLRLWFSHHVAHAHELLPGPRKHLAHDLSPVQLHGAFGHAEFASDALICVAGEHQGHDFALALGERGEALLQRGDGRRGLALHAVALDARVDGVEQLLIAE